MSNVNSLVDNYTLIREIEEFALKTGTIEYRACTSNEKGVTHYSTYSSYLCGKCCQAHQYMKCFEHHHVRHLLQTDNEQQNSIEKSLINLAHTQYQQTLNHVYMSEANRTLWVLIITLI